MPCARMIQTPEEAGGSVNPALVALTVVDCER
jgi:hypothetical protein